MVYLWKIKDNYPNHLIGEYDKSVSPDRFIFKKGAIFSDDTAIPVLKFDSKVEALVNIDDLANDSMLPVVSERLAKTVKDIAGDEIQLVDVEVNGSDGKLSGYKLLNVIPKVSGIDKAMSEITMIPGTDSIMGFKSLRYIDSCLGNHEIARDSEYSSNLIVSEYLASRISEINPVGVGLYLPHDIVW